MLWKLITENKDNCKSTSPYALPKINKQATSRLLSSHLMLNFMHSGKGTSSLQMDGGVESGRGEDANLKYVTAEAILCSNDLKLSQQDWESSKPYTWDEFTRIWVYQSTKWLQWWFDQVWDFFFLCQWVEIPIISILLLLLWWNGCISLRQIPLS